MLTFNAKLVTFFFLLKMCFTDQMRRKEDLPGGRNQVEEPIEHVAELRVILSDKGHETLAAGCSNHHIITATLLPQQVQSRSLQSNQ